MGKKITISIPEELYQSMDKWRGSFNFSKVFQDTISKEIKRKEDFKQRLKGGTDMEAVINRLRAEKATSDKDYFEQGMNQGLEFAKCASYDELQYALDWETTSEMPANTIGWDPTRNEILGDYFSQIIEEDDYMGFEQTIGHKCVPNNYFIQWEAGWKEGVTEFWDEIRDKI